MPKITAAFLGYRDEWEIEHVRGNTPDSVEIIGTPIDPTDTLIDRSFEAAANADVIIPWRFRFTGEDVARFPNLKLVQALSAGTDYLPKKELHERGIMVAGNHGSNSVAVAEMTVALIVGAYRHLQEQIRNIHAGKYHGDFFETWESYHELTGKRVGIIGLGQIGSKVAQRLQGWGCEVVYHDKVEVSPEVETLANATRVPLDELLSTSDVICLHVPLTENTRGIISDDEFAKMKPTSVIVSSCRGPVIDESALIRALENETIAGAGLDVTEIEPIESDNPLLNMRNVFLTPHLAGNSIEARQKAVNNASINITRLSEGKKPIGLIDPFE